MSNDIINHEGKVVELADDKVIAEIMVSEACGSCQAKGLCHAQGKSVRIEAPRAPGSHLEVGDSVNVRMSKSLAFSSVLLAYVAPLLLMMAVMMALIALTGSQDVGCIAALATLPCYYIALYKMRHRLRRKFRFDISASQ